VWPPETRSKTSRGCRPTARCASSTAGGPRCRSSAPIACRRAPGRLHACGLGRHTVSGSRPSGGGIGHRVRRPRARTRRSPRAPGPERRGAARRDRRPRPRGVRDGHRRRPVPTRRVAVLARTFARHALHRGPEDVAERCSCPPNLPNGRRGFSGPQQLWNGDRPKGVGTTVPPPTRRARPNAPTASRQRLPVPLPERALTSPRLC